MANQLPLALPAPPRRLALSYDGAGREFLHRARDHFTAGDFRAAACFCRMALEAHLRDWHNRIGLFPCDPGAGLPKLFRRLTKAGAVSRHTVQAAERILYTANRAAHGLSIRDLEVQHLLHATETLLRCRFSPDPEKLQAYTARRTAALSPPAPRPKPSPPPIPVPSCAEPLRAAVRPRRNLRHGQRRQAVGRILNRLQTGAGMRPDPPASLDESLAGARAYVDTLAVLTTGDFDLDSYWPPRLPAPAAL